MAITSYRIEEEVLTPKGAISIDYKGKNPFRLYHVLPAMLQNIFKGRGKNIFERSFKWDITSDPIEFSFEVWFEDWKFDSRTRPRIRVRVHGQQPSDLEKPNGIVKIEIKVLMATTYEFHNVFEKAIAMPFIWLYHRLIYNDVRRRYMQILKERTFQLESEIRKLYGMPFEKEDLSGGPPRLYQSI